MLKAPRPLMLGHTHCTPDARGWFFPEEGAIYNEFCSQVRRGGNIVEIGSYEGLSLSYIKDTIEKRKLNAWSVDWNERPKLLTNTKKWGIHFLHMPSVQAAEKFQNEFFDLIFIDADHSYEGCKADIEAWWPKLRPGGVIMGHDYVGGHPAVQRAVWESFNKGLDVRLTIWIYKRR